MLSRVSQWWSTVMEWLFGPEEAYDEPIGQQAVLLEVKKALADLTIKVGRMHADIDWLQGRNESLQHTIKDLRQQLKQAQHDIRAYHGERTRVLQLIGHVTDDVMRHACSAAIKRCGEIQKTEYANYQPLGMHAHDAPSSE